MNDQPEPQSPIACDMSVLLPDQRETHLANSRELFSRLTSDRISEFDRIDM
jgi:hypothetical protein